MRVEIEGVRGKGVRDLGEKGFVRSCIDVSYSTNKCIEVNAYEGWGESYKKRETPAIRICNNGEEFNFNSFDELIEQLRK